MTIKEKAKEKFGDEWYKKCPAKEFGIACHATNSFPDCYSKSCWEYHRTDQIEYKDNPKDMFAQQLLK